jgi:hypothetical protein
MAAKRSVIPRTSLAESTTTLPRWLTEWLDFGLNFTFSGIPFVFGNSIHDSAESTTTTGKIRAPTLTQNPRPKAPDFVTPKPRILPPSGRPRATNRLHSANEILHVTR